MATSWRACRGRVRQAQEKHCVVYGVSGEWEGQIVDPEITLETASADA